MNAFYPTQVGFTPTGYASGSQVIIGRNIALNWEAIGQGGQGRPDYVESVSINLVQRLVNGTLSGRGSINMRGTDVAALLTGNPHLPANLNLSLRQVLVCDNGVTKNMVVLASQTYATGSA